MKKTISLLLCLLLLLASLGACTSDDKTSEGETDGVATEYIPKTFDEHPSVLSINGSEISYAEYRYYFRMAMYGYGIEDEADIAEADDATKQKIKEKALSDLRADIALEDLAKKYSQSLPQSTLDEIHSLIENTQQSYESREEYLKFLELCYLTEDINLTVAKRYYLSAQLFDYLTGEESGYIIGSGDEPIRRFIDKYLVCGDRIFIRNDYGDDVVENEILINSIKVELDAGGEFNDLKKQYSEDSASSASDGGIYFGKGDVDDCYYDAVLALDTGEMSGIIESRDGYMIVKRLEFDWEYIEDNLSGEFTELYQDHMYTLLIEKAVGEQNVKFFDTYEGITVDTIE